jgi:hypothetical protein
MSRVTYYFPNTDLRSGHLGLQKIAAKEGKAVSTLRPGEFLLFVNRAKTAFKLFSSKNLIAHYRSEHRIDLRAVEYIPSAFDGGEFNFSAALKKVLEKDLKKRGIRVN